MAEVAAAPASAPVASGPTPPVWFALPPGYRPLDLTLSRERLTASVEGLLDGATAEGREWVAASVDALAAQFAAFRAGGITFAANGAHPAPGGGVDLSSLTAVVLATGDQDADTLVASLLMAESEQPDTTAVSERRYPVGPVVLAERRQTAHVGGVDTPIAALRATVPDPRRSHYLVLELSTSALHAWEDYRVVFTDLLLPTVTFSDPGAARRRDAATRAAADRLHTRLG